MTFWTVAGAEEVSADCSGLCSPPEKLVWKQTQLEQAGLEDVLQMSDGALIRCEAAGQQHNERGGDAEDREGEQGRAIHKWLEGEIEGIGHVIQRIAP